MNLKTSKLTYGAMMIAVFGVMLLLNRQTGGLFQEFILFIYPLPMVIFAVKYSFKDSLMVLAGMLALCFLIGAFSALFYGGTSAITGLVLGTCLRQKRNTSTTLLIVIAIASVVNLLDLVVLSSLSGLNIQMQIQELRESMNAMFAAQQAAGLDQAQIQQIQEMLSDQTLLRLFLISMVLLGIMQGLITYAISILVLRRLKYPVPKLTPLALYYPPMWTAYASLAGLVCYYISFTKLEMNEHLQAGMQIFGICSMMLTLVFGMFAVVLFLRYYMPRNKFLPGILGFASMFFFAPILTFLGMFYLGGWLHDWLLERLRRQAGNGSGSAVHH